MEIIFGSLLVHPCGISYGSFISFVVIASIWYVRTTYALYQRAMGFYFATDARPYFGLVRALLFSIPHAMTIFEFVI